MKNIQPRCALICVGSELLRGKVNTHASTLSRRLASIGIELAEEHTVADVQPSLTEAIRRALQTSSIVFITGGLGPTFDDLTREAAAEAARRQLTLSPPLLAGIKRKFHRARLTHMPPTNVRQAYLIEGARAIENTTGTAPGQWLELPQGRLVILLPGPPSELKPMLEDYVLPQLKKKFPADPRAEAHLHFVGVPESLVDHKIRPIIARAEKAFAGQIQFTILAHLGLVDFDIFVTASTAALARKHLAGLASAIRRRMGKSFYGMDADYPLEKIVGDGLRKRGATLALAESCTGGLLAGALTDIPGSSDYFKGGVVSYSNAVKADLLGVAPELLKRFGAVSAQVAVAMAVGVQKEMNATWGLSITGIAGPSGGTVAKPVGLVHMALVGKGKIRSFEFNFRGSRSAIRQRAVTTALDILRRFTA